MTCPIFCYRQKVKRRVSSGSRPHRPHAQLQMDVAGVPQAPFAIHGNPIMDNIARLNRTGLNGLSQCGTDGLQTVRLAHRMPYARPASSVWMASQCHGEESHTIFSHLLLVSRRCCAGCLPSDDTAANQLHY